jgi:hypothetical protein
MSTERGSPAQGAKRKRHPKTTPPRRPLDTSEPASQADLRRCDVDLSGPGVYPPPTERPRSPLTPPASLPRCRSPPATPWAASDARPARTRPGRVRC